MKDEEVVVVKGNVMCVGGALVGDFSGSTDFLV